VGAESADWWESGVSRGDDASSDPQSLIDDIDQGGDHVAEALTAGRLLRAERERLGVGLDEVEAATHIRAGHLRAIEDDRLDSLPGEAYARAFVRDYAEELGLDAAAVTDVFNGQWSRAHPDDQAVPEVVAYPRLASARRVTDRLELVAVALLAVVLVAIGAVVLSGRASSSTGHQHARTTPATTTPSNPATTGGSTGGSSAPRASRASIVLSATTGPCWVEAHAGGETGRLLVIRTLEPGDVLRLRRARIWVRLGDPAAARLVVNGKRHPLPATSSPVNLVVTRNGATAG